MTSPNVPPIKPQSPRRARTSLTPEQRVVSGCVGLLIGMLLAALILQAAWNDVIVAKEAIGLHAGGITYPEALLLWWGLSVAGRAFVGGKRNAGQ